MNEEARELLQRCSIKELQDIIAQNGPEPYPKEVVAAARQELHRRQQPPAKDDPSPKRFKREFQYVQAGLHHTDQVALKSKDKATQAAKAARTQLLKMAGGLCIGWFVADVVFNPGSISFFANLSLSNIFSPFVFVPLVGFALPLVAAIGLVQEKNYGWVAGLLFAGYGCGISSYFVVDELVTGMPREMFLGTSLVQLAIAAVLLGLLFKPEVRQMFSTHKSKPVLLAVSTFVFIWVYSLALFGLGINFQL